MIYEITNPDSVSSLFGAWEETMIYSCLQRIMGKIYADDFNKPTAAMAAIGDFIFFAGKPSAELAAYKPERLSNGFSIIVPQNERWKTIIAQYYGEKANIISRYALKKEPHSFDREKLEKAVASLPEQYTLSMIDEKLYHMCKAQAWSADLVSQFPSYENYRRLGIGAVVCKDGLLVSGASSYSRYREGIEIDIDTKKEYRRKGLAYVCGAKLILECLKRNLYPSWDAHNKGSLALAEKLGYRYSHTYTAIEVWDPSTKD
ncbi:MAG: GNAT family N-acetyltransferase [Lachnospiraceae bacterium]|nr:GNAT family N-acetyltransferase [Lachnospiraceae bacterium]